MSSFISRIRMKSSCRGYRPTTNDQNDELKFELHPDGTFLGLCDEARDNPDGIKGMKFDGDH